MKKEIHSSRHEHTHKGNLTIYRRVFLVSHECSKADGIFNFRIRYRMKNCDFNQTLTVHVH